MKFFAISCFLLFAGLLVLCAAHAPVFYDPDTAWHIAAGDWIREHHAVPLKDPWSFTARFERWYNISWAFDAGASWLFEKGGFTALYGITMVAFAASIAVMAQYSVARGASVLVMIALFPLILLIVYGSVLARPNLCSVILTLAFYLLLQRYHATRERCSLFLLPPLMAVWVNMHGGFLLAFPLTGVFALDALLRRDRVQLRWLGIAFAVCLAATWVNPYGFSVYYGAYRTITASFDQATLVEWQPVQIGKDIALTLLLVLTLWSGNATDSRIALPDRIIAVMMLLLALSSFRHGAIAALLMMPYLSLRLTSLLYESSYFSALQARDVSIRSDLQQKDVSIMAFIMACAAITIVTLPTTRAFITKAPLQFNAELFPATEAAFVAEHYPNAHFFNDYNIGGYLDFLWRGRVKLFVDGRSSSLFSPQLLEDYTVFSNAAGMGPKAQAIANEYKIDGLILLNTDKNSSDWAWNPAWKEVFHGPVATVYIKK